MENEDKGTSGVLIWFPNMSQCVSVNLKKHHTGLQSGYEDADFVADIYFVMAKFCILSRLNKLFSDCSHPSQCVHCFTDGFCHNNE